jgi:phosphatidylinositol dimannoside acyltransferase
VRLPGSLRRFLVRGVFWRQLLNWGVNNTPYSVEPPALAAGTVFFYASLTSARRATIRNLRAILPRSFSLANHARAFRMFWNFACTITDTARFNECGDLVDWEFDGLEHFERLVASPEGAIILTAHMGNYDLGSYLFARRMHRPLTIVRAPEFDAQTQAYVSQRREKGITGEFRTDYNTNPQMLALDLIAALQERQIVAIQGDRVVGPVTAHEARLFDRPALIPSGPFALALATGALIYPLFVIRVGWKRYRVTTFAPIECRRTGRDRNVDISRAVNSWIDVLQQMIRAHPHQWFMFESFERGVG